MGFSRQECWSGLPCPPPEHLLDLEIELMSLMSPALAAGFFATSATWEALCGPQPLVKLEGRSSTDSLASLPSPNLPIHSPTPSKIFLLYTSSPWDPGSYRYLDSLTFSSAVCWQFILPSLLWSKQLWNPLVTSDDLYNLISVQSDSLLFLPLPPSFPYFLLLRVRCSSQDLVVVCPLIH